MYVHIYTHLLGAVGLEARGVAREKRPRRGDHAVPLYVNMCIYMYIYIYIYVYIYIYIHT